MCKLYTENRNNAEIPYHLIRKSLESIDTLEHVYLFGGEPLLYSHIKELLELVGEKNIPALITTNGTVLNRYAEAIVKAEIRDIDISVDSSNEDTYRKIRKNGELHKVIENIDLLFKQKEKYHSQYPRIGISCVILPDNCGELVDFYQFFIHRFPDLDRVIFEFPMKTNKKCGVDTDIIYTEYFDCRCESWKWFYKKVSDFSEAEQDILSKQIKILKTCDRVMIQGENSGRSFIPEKAAAAGMKCNYPFSTMTVLENGHATFCTDYPDIILGDLNNASLKHIWNGEKANKFRNYVDNNGFLPICECCTHCHDIIKSEMESK